MLTTIRRGPSPVLIIEAWSLSKTPELEFPVIKQPIHPSPERTGIFVSPDGKYLAAQSEIFDLSEPPRPHLLPFHPPAEGDASITFCHGKQIFAYTYEEENQVSFQLLAIQPDRSLQLLATHAVQTENSIGPRDIKVAFHCNCRHDHIILAFSYWTEFGYNETCVVAVRDNDTVVEKVSEGMSKYTSLKAQAAKVAY